MRFKLDINYSGEELRFLEEHSGGVYIAEIMDDETSSLVWAVLQKWKGIYHFPGEKDGGIVISCQFPAVTECLFHNVGAKVFVFLIFVNNYKIFPCEGNGDRSGSLFVKLAGQEFGI